MLTRPGWLEFSYTEPAWPGQRYITSMYRLCKLPSIRDSPARPFPPHLQPPITPADHTNRQVRPRETQGKHTPRVKESAHCTCAPFSTENNVWTEKVAGGCREAMSPVSCVSHVCSFSICRWQAPRVMMSASMPGGEKRTHVGWENMQARGWRVGHRPRTFIPHRHVLRRFDDAFCDINHAVEGGGNGMLGKGKPIGFLALMCGLR